MAKDKAKVKAGPVNAGRLKSFVERIEKLDEERRAIGSDIKDVYSEAKGVGYDADTIRWAVSERRMNAADRDERDTLREVYAHALGLAVEAVRNGMTYREAEEEFGFSKSAIHRASHQTRDSGSGTAREMVGDDLGEWLPPHDRETGELPREMSDADLGDPLWVIDKPRAQFREKVRAAAASANVTRIVDTSPPPRLEDDDLAIPSFLKREKRDPVPA